MSNRSHSDMWETSQHEGHAGEQHLFNMSPGSDSSAVEMNLHVIGGGLESSLPLQEGLGLSSWSDTGPWVPLSNCGSLPVPALQYNYGPHRGREASVTTASATGQDFVLSPGSAYSSHDRPVLFPPADAGSGLEDEFGDMVYDDPSETGESQRKRMLTTPAPEAPQSNNATASSAPRSVKRAEKSDPILKQKFECEEIVMKDDGQEGPCGEICRIYSDLKKHQDKHRKPHKCRHPDCGKGFTTSSDLDRHALSLHKIISSKGARVYHCGMPKCSESFDKATGQPRPKVWTRKDNFKQHITRSHPEIDADQMVKNGEERLPQYPIHLSSEVDLNPGSLRHSRPPPNAYFESRKPSHVQYASCSSDGLPQHTGYNGYIYGPQSCSAHCATISAYNRPVAPDNDIPYTYGSFEQHPSSDTSSYSYTTPSRTSSHTSQSIHDGYKSPCTGKSEIKVPVTAAPPRPQHLDPNQSLTRSIPAGRRSTGPSSRRLTPQSCSPFTPAFDLQGTSKRRRVERPRGQTSGCSVPGSNLVAAHDPCQQRPEFFPQAHHMSNQYMMFPDIGNPHVALAPRMVSCEHPQPRKYNLAPTTTQLSRSEPGQGGLKPKPDLIKCGFRQEDGQQCPKQFKAKSVFQKHTIRHEKLFACTFEECPTTKRFGSKNDWKRHESSQHKEGIKEQWRCSICGTCFNHHYTFEAHLIDTANYTCGKSRPQAKDCHVRIEGGGGFWCGFCENIISIDHDTPNAEDDRSNHIANHFLPNRCEITNWRLPCGLTKKEAEERAILFAAETGEMDEASDNTSESTDAAHRINSGQEDDEDSESSLDDADGDMEEDDDTTSLPSDVNITSQANYQAHYHTPHVEGRHETLGRAASLENGFQSQSNKDQGSSDLFSCCACGACYNLDGMQTRCMGFIYGDCNHMFCEDCPGFL